MTLNWVETLALDFMVGQALKKKILEVSFLWVLFPFKGRGQGVPFHAVTDNISFMEYFFFGGLLHRFEYLFYPSCSYRGDNQ